MVSDAFSILSCQTGMNGNQTGLEYDFRVSITKLYNFLEEYARQLVFTNSRFRSVFLRGDEEEDQELKTEHCEVKKKV